jgi:hypothetical protein
MTIIDVFDVFNGITVIDNGVWFGVLTKSVDRCKSMWTRGVNRCRDISNRMANWQSNIDVVDNELD